MGKYLPQKGTVREKITHALQHLLNSGPLPFSANISPYQTEANEINSI